MRSKRLAILALALLGACSASEDAANPPVVVGPDASTLDAGDDGAPLDGAIPDGSPPDDAGSDGPDASTTPGNLRILAGNISSGPALDYTPAETKRLLQGLKPDVALLQELKVGGGTQAEVDAFVADAFGASFTYFREPGPTANDLPNGVISRFPIAESGSWVDPQVTNRSFVYAKITIPGPKPLWAISVHLLTSNASARNTEAASLVAKIKSTVPAGDYVVVGGDFNTSTRTETCLATFGEILVSGAPFPADDVGNDNTSAPRSKPFDWLIGSKDLVAKQVPVRLGGGGKVFAAGLVFDSRVHTPLADVAPIQATDSAAMNMQHMPVVKDFYVAP